MDTATDLHAGRIVHRPPSEIRRVHNSHRPSAAVRLELIRVFGETVLRYLLGVLPQASRELERWRTRAQEIPDPQLRRAAGDALRKRGNVEGAALFATLAPAPRRRGVVRALVAFQTAYNYLDALSELPSDDPIANGDRLHRALADALHPGAAHLDYYACNPQGGDGGYLVALVDACRDALAALPSYPLVAPAARAAGRRIVDYQALNLSRPQGGHDALERWAAEAGPACSGLQWWETAAAAGSSLAVNALIAAAADARLDPRDVREIEGAYFPWIGALHSLLDSLVDRHEDHEGERRCLLDYYDTMACAADRLAELATRAREAVGHLPNPEAHRVILTAMASYYLSAPECHTCEARTIASHLKGALGLPLSLAILMFRVRRHFHTITRRTYT